MVVDVLMKDIVATIVDTSGIGVNTLFTQEKNTSCLYYYMSCHLDVLTSEVIVSTL